MESVLLLIVTDVWGVKKYSAGFVIIVINIGKELLLLLTWELQGGAIIFTRYRNLCFFYWRGAG